MNYGRLNLSSILSQPFGEYTYILALQDNQECLVVDPGMEPNKIFDELDTRQLTPIAILNTHGHSDHIAGNEAMKDRWPNAPLIIGEGDAFKLTDPVQNLSAGFGINLISPEADQTVKHGEVLSLAGIELEVFDTPGHSIGHVVFVWKPDDSPWVVVGGDVLFAGGIGRTDFPDGNYQDLERSIHEILFKMPDDTIVLPGHGPATQIGHEKRTNPFVGAPAGYRG